MSRHFFGAMRDFVFVRLPHYLRAVAIFLIFASPVLATLYFAPTLDHFNKSDVSRPVLCIACAFDNHILRT